MVVCIIVITDRLNDKGSTIPLCRCCLCSQFYVMFLRKAVCWCSWFIVWRKYPLQNSYFIDDSNVTKSGVIDSIFENKPRYALIDEIDKMSPKDQSFLLNLMEADIVTETSIADILGQSKNKRIICNTIFPKHILVYNTIFLDLG